jgi:uncharacterized radical SAM superfamily Fe-S cluster-containing enzyme
MSAAEHMKDQLGPALCLAKWQQVSLHLTTGMTNSCYHPPLHEIPVEPLKFYPSALHNTAHKKEQRKLMLAGQRPSECSYCWSAENNGQLSDRHYRSGEPWAAEHYEEIVNAPWDMDATPSYVEVNFNHACNLACSYCSPQFSTAHVGVPIQQVTVTTILVTLKAVVVLYPHVNIIRGWTHFGIGGLVYTVVYVTSV